jgi:hypothetical protein
LEAEVMDQQVLCTEVLIKLQLMEDMGLCLMRQTGRNSSPATSGGDTALTNNVWTNGTEIYPTDNFDWYKFEATSDKTYNLNWDQSQSWGWDSNRGSGNYNGSIKVSAYRSDGTTVFNDILNVVNGYGTPSIISGYTGTVYIKVQGESADNTGTYIIKYAEN